ncbi:MAG: hypothetical protein RRZ72_04390, partial [Victivallaceae bacterium]
MTSWLSERYETLNSTYSFCNYSDGFIPNLPESQANAITKTKCQQITAKLFSRFNSQNESYYEKQFAESRSFYHCSDTREKYILFGSSQKAMPYNKTGERSRPIPLNHLLFKSVTKTPEKNLEPSRPMFPMTDASKNIIQNTKNSPQSNIPETLIRTSSERMHLSQLREVRLKTEPAKSYGLGSITKFPELLENRLSSFIFDKPSSSGEDQGDQR